MLELDIHLRIRATKIGARKKGDHQKSPLDPIIRGLIVTFLDIIGTLQDLGLEVKSSIAYRR